MDRRGFLGMLASLPIVAGFKARPEEEKHFQSTPINRDDPKDLLWDNEDVDKMIRHKTLCACSGIWR